jgi:tetratricopeptide (TPR) repeat protein
MSEKNKSIIDEDSFEAVESTLTRTERYIEENKKSLSIIVAAIVLIIGGYLGFNKYVVEPQEEEAASQMFMAEHYFAIDSFKVALNGNGEYPGFIEIADEYSITKSGNLANYYAGVCYLKLGEYENAIEAFKKFNSDDEMIMTLALSSIGDAYMELGNTDDAISYYKKASERKPNKFITPMILFKLGTIYESINDYASALEAYKKIQTEYPKSNEGRNIRKYVSRTKYKVEG